MRRREFIAALAGAAALRFPAHAQQAMPTVGFVRSTTAGGFKHLEAALRQGLKEAGFVEGQNVAIESRYADDQVDRLPALIADLISRPVAVIVTNQVAALAAKAATTTVPIVFATGTDPVRNGLVANLSRPGANVTGAVFFGPDLITKRFELLHQLVPKATTFGVMIHPGSPLAEVEQREVLAAAQARGLRLLVFGIRDEPDIEKAFAALVKDKADALLVGSAAFINSHWEQLTTLAARHKLPAMTSWRTATAGGGLMEFVINLKAAKALGIEVPDRILALADEVIE